MGNTKCRSCGVAIGGKLSVCEYCGVLLINIDTIENEEKALDELHALLLKSNLTSQKKLLRNGFLPDIQEVLIEAGLRCIPLIVNEDIEDEPRNSAVYRLDAIRTKLKIKGSSDDAKRAQAEFKKVIKKNKKSDLINQVIGLVFILGILGGIGYLIYRIAQWIIK